jgi:hypothetical protein
MNEDKVLKPCPFCGGDPRIIQRKLNEPDEWRMCAYCPSCDPRFMNAISVDLWNARPIEDKLLAENERLTALVENAKVTINGVMEKSSELRKALKSTQEIIDRALS